MIITPFTSNTLRVVNIGTGPSKNDGDQLRTAFNKINLNFADIVSGNIAVSGGGGGTGNGYTGSQGSVGPSGNIGYTGSQGGIGPAGPAGATGPQAVAATLKGAVASNGDLPASNNAINDAYYVSGENSLYVWDGANWFNAGPIVGPSGVQGPTGLNGYAGSQGPNGYTGSQGTNGATGATGPNGINGLPGYTGSRGASGAAGSSIKFLGAVATISNLPTGSNNLNDAYVVFSNGSLYIWDGTTWIDCGALVGLVGATGPAGATGLAGPSGLIGPVGASGATGPAGLDGDLGPVGATGATGVPGPSGLVGASGAVGPSGSIGASGLKGTTGATGPIGLTGYTGSVGPSGPQGIGATGIKGYTGSVGPSGSPGSIAKVQSTIPTSSVGKSGDAAGDIVVDLNGGHLYVCSKNYDGSSLIWVRLNITDTSF